MDQYDSKVADLVNTGWLVAAARETVAAEPNLATILKRYAFDSHESRRASAIPDGVQTHSDTQLESRNSSLHQASVGECSLKDTILAIDIGGTQVSIRQAFARPAVEYLFRRCEQH